MTETTSRASTPKLRALVTGGATRLGREVCLCFGAAGWDVAVHYNRSENLARALKEEMERSYPAIDVSLHQAELSSELKLKSLFEDVTKDPLKGLDCIVNNASLFVPDTGIDFTSELAMEQIKVNLLAPMKLGQFLAQFILEKKSLEKPLHAQASIVHILDQKVFNLNPDYFSYTLSKLALERAVSLQAQSLAPHIRVNAVSPGLMYLSGEQTPENFAKASKINLLEKAIDPKDVAKSCLFLANTSSLTGTTIRVDCGQHLVPLARDVMFMVDEWMHQGS
jgi:NAD(P)-dependent dehydrogenase (short-subunit alcohol dehydrogenase family)